MTFKLEVNSLESLLILQGLSYIIVDQECNPLDRDLAKRTKDNIDGQIRQQFKEQEIKNNEGDKKDN